MKLIVIEPFGEYQKGQMIVDEQEIEEVLEYHESHVVKTNAEEE